MAIENVPINGGYWHGADGHRIELISNASSSDPDWNTLLAFLQQDQTDRNLYNASTFINPDYAEMLHNNAEAAGIRTALVSIEINTSSSGSRSWWYLLNAFNTPDRGLLYIDDTGADKYCPSPMDQITDIELNQPYRPRLLLSNTCFYVDWGYCYIVRNISVNWDTSGHEYVPLGGYHSGADGHLITLINNPQAHDPAFQELKDFLQQDNTDTYLYNSSTFVCTDYAEMLHNNAEEAGIRTAFVTVNFTNESSGHALNAFSTTDIGLVYIDDTGGYSHQPCSNDRLVAVEVGKAYIPIPIVSCEGSSSVSCFNSFGNVSAIYTTW